MPRAWRRRLDYMSNMSLSYGFVPGRFPHPRGEHANNPDAIPPEGGPSASSPTFMVKDLLDRYQLEYALLVPLQPAVSAVAAADAEFSAVPVSAFNDFMLERWMVDPRFRYALVVSPIDPELACAEIRKHGKNPNVSAVYMPLWRERLGNRRYYPIYKTAVEYGLPMMTHPIGEGVYEGGPPTAGGVSELYGERMGDSPLLAAANVSSLIFQGVFERFPELQFMFLEFRFAWAVTHMWEMDKTWRCVRLDSPWVKRWPSEYVHDHVTFATQPIPEPHDPKQLDRLIEDYLSDSVVFSSDYPHWNNDRPRTVFRSLRSDVREKVFHDNARRVLRLPK
jgi:predicted TIM-barrel fold metal-dependent hydrolase